MTDFELGKSFYLLEEEYRDLITELTVNQDKYQKCGYKGWAWLQGPLIYHPDVLFVGYNPGQGKDWKKTFHMPFTGERQLACFEDNNAYYNPDQEKQKGLPTPWYAFNDKYKGNSFDWQLLKIIKGCAEKLYPNETDFIEQSEIPKWLCSFGKRISFINLYPMATKDEKTLKKLLAEIHKNDSEIILKLYEGYCKKKIEREWDLRCPFVCKVRKFREWISPKLTVCLGSETFHDFTADRKKTKVNENRLLINSSIDSGVFGFDRGGQWPIDAVVDEVVNRLK